MKIDWKKRAKDGEKNAEKFRNAVRGQLEIIIWYLRGFNYGLARERAEFLLDKVRNNSPIGRL